MNTSKQCKSVLLRNALVFDGRNEQLSEPLDVLIEGNKITRIENTISTESCEFVVDADRRVMTPGFIDAHSHVMFQMPFAEAFSSDEFYWAYVSVQTASIYLSRGFTTIREVGGNAFSLKKAIDRGIIDGPRIFPSGPMISQTSGHSDHRTDAQKSALVAWEPSVPMKYDMVQIADGRPEVLKAAREALRRGASQVKISVGGGTGSYADPMDVTQYTIDEISAAVDAATDWGRYVVAHAYTDNAVQRAVEAGVKSIEHGNLITEPTLRLMQENDVWLSPQVIVYTFHPTGYTEDMKKKHDQAFGGIDNMFTTAKKIGFEKIAFGSDIITDPGMIARINEEFVHRTQWFTPFEILRQATSYSAELLALSGPRNPYHGQIGVIEKGAYADLLLIQGNPLADISILTTPEKNLDLIMKDGKIWKNNITNKF